ncbi:MAG TPA: beta-L-arabinofuranosidase domain-containing protein [Vicinamibacterales bacterium]
MTLWRSSHSSILFTTVTAAAVLVVALSMSGSTQARGSRADIVAYRAEPFPLQDVRLLDGPFREAMLRDQRYLLDLDPDRLLHNFRVNAGLPSTAQPLGGWEAPDVELRGHSVGHYLSALALMYASTGDGRFKARGDIMVTELAKVQDALAAKGANKGYLSAFPEAFIDRVDGRRKVWAPYYTLHKIMAGLLDTYQLCGNQQALEVVTKSADWVKFRMDRLTREQQQAMLMTEHGGMTEVLANLSAVTGNPEHLRVARLFDHAFLIDPLARHEDTLNGLHANTQIPKAIGAAREYELTGEPRYREIATFFWERVALRRSYANGGHSDDELFFPVENFSEHLGASSSETCNTYNMLKLTRHLFSWSPSARLMDFYERGLFNHILASQDPATGMMIYYCPLLPGGFRSYSTPDASFWCCVGTGMENHGKYPDTIYFHDDKSLFVNLFLASELNWRAKGLRVRQDTKFPEDDSTRLSFTADRPIRLALKIRFPSWATNGMTLAVNGAPQTISEQPGSYVSVDREWKSGDTVQVRLPMAVHTEAMPDNPNLVAVLYGPILLAGDLGKDGLTPAVRYGPSAPPVRRMAVPAVPAFVTTVAAVASAVKPVPDHPLTFRTSGIGRPTDVTLIPFYRASDVRYTVYWEVMNAAAWEKRSAERAAADARRAQLGTRTIDTVDTGKPESESTHHFQHQGAVKSDFDGRFGREATGTGWFSYELKVVPDQPLKLVCLYRGSEGSTRTFDVLVDGEKVASETLPYHPTEFLDVEYAVPITLTRGKTRVTVRFQPRPGAATGQVYEIAVVSAGK